MGEGEGRRGREQGRVGGEGGRGGGFRSLGVRSLAVSGFRV